MCFGLYRQTVAVREINGFLVAADAFGAAHHDGSSVPRTRDTEAFEFSAACESRAGAALLSLLGLQGLIELVGGILIVIGLFTRSVAFILAGDMAIAYFMAHAPRGFFPLVNGGQLAILLCFVFLYLSVAGSGVWSVDN